MLNDIFCSLCFSHDVPELVVKHKKNQTIIEKRCRWCNHKIDERVVNGQNSYEPHKGFQV